MRVEMVEERRGEQGKRGWTTDLAFGDGAECGERHCAGGRKGGRDGWMGWCFGGGEEGGS